ncbi:MAG: HAD family hydrolase [Flavobacteriales bacterium]|nr:HAD family hydrolase [Flavobacteriales bacterium]
MNKALFLDRDGVLNRERGEYTFRSEDFELLPDVIESLKLAQEKDYLLIVISNQGGIAKGIYLKSDVEKLHGILNSTLKTNGVHLSEIYYCPHHNELGKCLCRKPNSLMLEKAIARFDVDVTRSLMIGDSDRDVRAAENVGVNGVRIDPNTSILEIVSSLK